MPVYLFLEKLAGGTIHDEVMAEYDLSKENILAALDYAAKHLSDGEVRAYLIIQTSALGLRNDKNTLRLISDNLIYHSTGQ